MKLLRRGTALVLSIALMFSLIAVVASPNWTNTTSLGLLSRYYETGKTNTDAQAAAMISTVAGDPGGKSYGAYMFASKTGTVESFISWCRTAATNTAIYDIGDRLYRAYYSNGAGCGPLFDQAWLEVATDYGSAFFTAQEAFSKSQIYDKAIELIKSTADGYYFNIDNYSVALKNVIWSRAVHHGPSGAASIVKDAFASLGGFANQAERDIIMAIYNQSGKVVEDYNGAAKMNGSLAAKYDVDGKVLRYWYGSSAGVQLAVYRRLNVNEPADALSMLQANVNAPLSEGNYTIHLKMDSSTLALGVAESNVKVVNTTGESAGTAAKFTLHYLSGVGAYTINTAVGETTMRLAAGTAGSDGFGAVTLASPSTSDSQLWYVESDGGLKNKATGTYLSYKNDKLVMVGTEGTEVSLSTTVDASAEATNIKTVTGQKTVETTVEGQGTTTTEPAGPTVTYVADQYGTFKEDETLVLTSTTNGESITYTLGALPTVSAAEGYTFTGWFVAGGAEAVTTTTAVPAEGLTLYAKYTKVTTSTVSPSGWTFSPVVKDASDFTVHHLIYPDGSTELHEGDSSFPVRGMITSSGKITNVTLTISGPKSLSKSVSPNANYYDLGNMDSSIAYSSLTQGAYTYTLTATVGGTVYTLKTSEFTVGAKKTPDVTTPSSPSGDTFTVTFDAGTNGTSEYTSKTYSLDSIVYGTLPSVTMKSSTVEFVGWYTSDGVQILPGSPIVAENITLYAKYTNEYTYKFLKASSGTYKVGTAAAGTVFTAPDSGPTKSPDSSYTYTFSHWVDSKGVKYYSGQAIVMGEGDMTFTPVYTQKSYTTTPNGGGGSSSGGGGGTTTTTPSGPVWTISPGTTVSQIDGTVYSGGSIVTSGKLATGMVVKDSGGEYTISVTGDTSGDGNVSVTDVVKLQSHLLNKITLKGAYLDAGDLNRDGKVTITDLVKSARVVAGKDTIG